VAHFLTPAGVCYEGARQHQLDAEVPERPSSDHTWDGERWQPPTTAALDAKKELAAMADVDVAVLRVVAERLFDLDTRVRALEGRAPISAAAYRRALLDRIKELL